MARTEISPIKTPPKNAAQKPPQKTPPAGYPNEPLFSIRQTRLCAELSMSEDELRRRRDHFLNQGQHWDYIDKRVLYSEVGAQVLRGTRDAVLPARGNAEEASGKNASTTDSVRARRPIALLLEKNPTRLELAFKGKLIVWAAPGHNTKVVICYLPGSDPQNPLNLVTLRVRDNANFLRGMEIPGTKPPGSRVKVTPVADRDDVFDLQGPTPRQRGRW